MPTSANKLIMRCQWEAYMDCGTGGTQDFNLIGEGFTTFPESKNPKEYSRHYVNELTERTDVVGYSPSISYSCDCVVGDPCVQQVIDVTDKELLGTATHRDIVSVNCWDETSDGVYAAIKRTYAIVPDGKGDGTDALIYTGTLKAVSDKVEGTFNRDKKTFTPTQSSSDTK